MYKRSELNVHTISGVSYSVATVNEYIAKANEWKLNEIAFTDHHSIEEFSELKSLSQPSTAKIIYGLSVNLFDDTIELNDDRHNVKFLDKIVMLAKNEIGMKNISAVCNEVKKSKIRKLLKRDLAKFREGILVGASSSCSKLHNAVVLNWHDDINDIFDAAYQKKILDFYDYIELDPYFSGLYNSGYNMMSVKFIAEMCQKFNKPVVAVSGACMINESDAHKMKARAKNESGMEYKGDCPYLHSAEELLEKFDFLGKEKAKEIVITNPNIIADMIEL